MTTKWLPHNALLRHRSVQTTLTFYVSAGFARIADFDPRRLGRKPFPSNDLGD